MFRCHAGLLSPEQLQRCVASSTMLAPDLSPEPFVGACRRVAAAPEQGSGSVCLAVTHREGILQLLKVCGRSPHGKEQALHHADRRAGIDARRDRARLTTLSVCVPPTTLCNHVEETIHAFTPLRRPDTFQFLVQAAQFPIPTCPHFPPYCCICRFSVALDGPSLNRILLGGAQHAGSPCAFDPFRAHTHPRTHASALTHTPTRICAPWC